MSQNKTVPFNPKSTRRAEEAPLPLFEISSSAGKKAVVGRISPKNTFPKGSYSEKRVNSPQSGSLIDSPYISSLTPSSNSPLSSFRTSFCSHSVSRRYTSATQREKNESMYHSASSMDSIEDDLFVHVSSNARDDLDMQQQMMTYAAEERERVAAINARARVTAKRDISHEKIHLKALVAEGMKYQGKNTKPSSFVKKIMAASQASVQARAPGSCCLITADQAQDLSFVASVLSADVENIYPQYGYGTTLNSIVALRMWDLN